MRLPIFGLALAVVPIVLGGNLPRAADEQLAPLPGLSPRAVVRYQQMIESLAPETVTALAADAKTLPRVDAGAPSDSASSRALTR